MTNKTLTPQQTEFISKLADLLDEYKVSFDTDYNSDIRINMEDTCVFEGCIQVTKHNDFKSNTDQLRSLIT